MDAIQYSRNIKEARSRVREGLVPAVQYDTAKPWDLPELVFLPTNKDATFTITSSGHIKVSSETHSEIMCGEQQSPLMINAVILSVDDKWVKHGHERLDKFPNPRLAGDFFFVMPPSCASSTSPWRLQPWSR